MGKGESWLFRPIGLFVFHRLQLIHFAALMRVDICLMLKKTKRKREQCATAAQSCTAPTQRKQSSRCAHNLHQNYPHLCYLECRA